MVDVYSGILLSDGSNLRRAQLIQALGMAPSQAGLGTLLAPSRGFAVDSASGWYRRGSDAAHVYVMGGIETLWLRATGSVDGLLLVSGATTAINFSVLLTNGGLTPQMFGAKGDGSTNDLAAFTAWFAALMATGLPGLIPAGHYWLPGPLSWDIGAVLPYGVQIRTHGPDQTILDFTGYAGGSGPALFFGNSSASGANFYSRIEPFRVNGSMPGVMVMIGRENFSDALNSVSLGMIAQNGSTDQTAVTVEVNGAYQCKLDIVANGSGKNSKGGVSLRLRQTQFCTIETSAGNNCIGLQMCDGTVYGNVFLRMDLEECNIGGQISATGTMVTKNTILGGTIADCMIGFDAQAGKGNKLINVNNVATTRLGGSGGLDIDAPGENYVTTTPAFPVSNTPVANTFGTPVQIGVLGLVTSVAVNGAIVSMGPCVVTLRNGDTITPVYPSSVTPSWSWASI